MEKFTYGYDSVQFKKFKKYAWLMLLSFGFTYLFFYNGRQNINLVMDLMKEHFSSDLGTIGVVSSALFWCYAFGQLVSGRLGSYFGYKKLMIFGVVASAIQASVFGFVQQKFGWNAIFITTGCLYIVLLVLTLCARKMKMKKL